MMDIERFLYLLGRYEQGMATEAEEAAFLAFFGDPDNRAEIEGLFVGMLDHTALGEVPDPARWQPVIDRILDKAGNDIAQMPSLKRGLLGNLRRHRWWAAAAIILLCIASGSYFFFFNKSNSGIAKTETRQSYKNDIPPGGNKAILTLSGGQKIILDSAANGTLAQQGNTNIIKVDSGKLAYAAGTSQEEVVYNILTTPRGGQYRLTLPDGTDVWLNAASSIRYPTAFAGNERRVELTGEAYFEVKHNAAMPFKVKTRDMLIEDLGTSFNVMAYEEEPMIKTTLLEGSVRVTKAPASIVLEPGQQALVDASGKMSLIWDADIEAALAWKNGLFRFRDESIETIMRQVSRWYDVDVEYQGNVKDMRFGAAISRKENVSKLLQFLELTGTVHFKIDNHKITITP